MSAAGEGCTNLLFGRPPRKMAIMSVQATAKADARPHPLGPFEVYAVNLNRWRPKEASGLGFLGRTHFDQPDRRVDSFLSQDVFQVL